MQLCRAAIDGLTSIGPTTNHDELEERQAINAAVTRTLINRYLVANLSHHK
jgi:hypothetical protein